MIRFVKTTIKHVLSPKYAYLRKFDIRRGDVVIDLGANVGEVSEYFLRKGAIVHAYEPNAHAAQVLLQRLGCKKNLHFYPLAVAGFTGRSKLYLHRDHHESELTYSQAGSLCSEKDNVCEDFIEIDVVSIRDVLAAHKHIKLLKIDIEGGEYDIMDEILARLDTIDTVLLETHENKSAVFREKNDELMEKIEKSGVKGKIRTDWF
jgi:FkbM family methyltransferase